MFETEKETIIQNSAMAGGASLEEHLQEWRKVRSFRFRFCKQFINF
jgi:hypothetical protein